MKKNKKNPKENEDILEEKITEDEKPESEVSEEIEGDDVLDLLKIEHQKLKDDYLRALAEGENIKRRCAQEIEKNSKYAISSFAKDLLGVADNLQRALEAAQKDENCEALLKGVELTNAELIRVFNKFGIQKMDIIGKHFDPNFHQVVQEIEAEGQESGTIITELQTGYMLNDRILREAMVIVAK